MQQYGEQLAAFDGALQLGEWRQIASESARAAAIDRALNVLEGVLITAAPLHLLEHTDALAELESLELARAAAEADVVSASVAYTAQRAALATTVAQLAHHNAAMAEAGAEAGAGAVEAGGDDADATMAEAGAEAGAGAAEVRRQWVKR
eukprot:6387679-Prymnesium_polylepis.1